MLRMSSKSLPLRQGSFVSATEEVRDRDVEGPQMAEYQHGVDWLFGPIWSLFANCVLHCTCQTGRKRESPLLLTCKRSCKDPILQL
jgi:hypothetical protein